MVLTTLPSNRKPKPPHLPARRGGRWDFHLPRSPGRSAAKPPGGDIRLTTYLAAAQRRIAKCPKCRPPKPIEPGTSARTCPAPSGVSGIGCEADVLPATSFEGNSQLGRTSWILSA